VRWAAQTPADFRFAVTMPRRATWFGRIEGLDAFAQTVCVLGDRLGPVRIKVPQKRDDGFLRLLLDSLDPGIRWALDFRHESWAAPDVEARMDERGVALVNSLKGRASFHYLRLREPPYDDPALEAIAASVAGLLEESTDVFCYFRHEDKPTAPLYAERLSALVRSSSR
jgi:uncharacterized protein YecE (DUF72 family)